MGRHIYEMWAGPNDPSWFSLCNSEQQRWEKFATEIDDEYWQLYGNRTARR